MREPLPKSERVKRADSNSRRGISRTDTSSRIIRFAINVCTRDLDVFKTEARISQMLVDGSRGRFLVSFVYSFPSLRDFEIKNWNKVQWKCHEIHSCEKKRSSSLTFIFSKWRRKFSRRKFSNTVWSSFYATCDTLDPIANRVRGPHARPLNLARVVLAAPLIFLFLRNACPGPRHQDRIPFRHPRAAVRSTGVRRRSTKLQRS